MTKTAVAVMDFSFETYGWLNKISADAGGKKGKLSPSDEKNGYEAKGGITAGPRDPWSGYRCCVLWNRTRGVGAPCVMHVFTAVPPLLSMPEALHPRGLVTCQGNRLRSGKAPSASQSPFVIRSKSRQPSGDAWYRRYLVTK